MGNPPPTLWFSDARAKVTGPPAGIAGSFSGVAGQSVAITFFADDVKEKGGKAFNVATVSLHSVFGRMSIVPSAAGTSDSVRTRRPSKTWRSGAGMSRSRCAPTAAPST